MPVTPITDLVQRAKDRLPEQFKDKINVEKMIEIIMEELQEAEDAILQLQRLQSIDEMEGENLDIIGQHLVQPRGGLSDAAYRDILRVKIGINTSAGADEPLMTVFKLLTNSTIARATEIFPAGVQLFGNGDNINAEIIQQLRSIVAATVDIVFILSGGRRPFAFEGGEDLGGGYTSIHIADPEAEGHGAYSTVIVT